MVAYADVMSAVQLASCAMLWYAVLLTINISANTAPEMKHKVMLTYLSLFGCSLHFGDSKLCQCENCK